jgi:hypothetical protein
MARTRAADDFAAIRARMEELRRKHEPPTEPEDNLRARVRRVPIEEIARAAQSSLWGSLK